MAWLRRVALLVGTSTVAAQRNNDVPFAWVEGWTNQDRYIIAAVVSVFSVVFGLLVIYKAGDWLGVWPPDCCACVQPLKQKLHLRFTRQASLFLAPEGSASVSPEPAPVAIEVGALSVVADKIRAQGEAAAVATSGKRKHGNVADKASSAARVRAHLQGGGEVHGEELPGSKHGGGGAAAIADFTGTTDLEAADEGGGGHGYSTNRRTSRTSRTSPATSRRPSLAIDGECTFSGVGGGVGQATEGGGGGTGRTRRSPAPSLVHPLAADDAMAVEFAPRSRRGSAAHAPG